MPTGVPAAMPNASVVARALTTVRRIIPASSYEVLYKFAGYPDGSAPTAGLINVGGTLYGTTEQGGTSYLSAGTAYSISTTGVERVLYSFAGGSDGAYPYAGLIKVKGRLYGTTYGGGSGCDYGFGCGTFYSTSTTGSERVLHRFGRGSDGQFPFAGLTRVKGTLYGTTAEGGGSGCNGDHGCGTVYATSTTGSGRVLHRFGRGMDGSGPTAGLLNVNGTLYGTTQSGGSSDNGTVYTITTTGAERVLYSFAGSPDGATPFAGLINVNGTLNGTTERGGSSGDGTVYSITTTGVEKVLHSFAGGSDGAYPIAGLIDVKGTLYGTTQAGGGSRCERYNVVCGTVYSISTSGVERVLHRFRGLADSDGATPDAGLVEVNGRLYGTTQYGGGGGGSRCGDSGCGTVFSLSP